MFSRRETVGNAKIFLVGKVLSAVATVFWLGYAVRKLGVDEYATYVASIATLEVGLLLSSVGLDWAVLRFAPEFRVRGAYGPFVSFLKRIVAARVSAIAVLIGAGWLASNLIDTPALSVLSKTGGAVAGLLFSEAVLRIVRDNALESLGRQLASQVGITFRTTALIVLVLGAALAGYEISAQFVLILELVASLFTLVFSLLAIRFALRRARNDAPVAASGAARVDAAPRFSVAWRLGFNNYLSTLVSAAMSTQVLVLVVSMLAGPQVLAAFGFVCRLFDIARGYVPALMLMSVLRPRFISLYTRTQSFEVVSAEALIASRWSILSVAPVVGVLILFGDDIVRYASGGQVSVGGFQLSILIATLLIRVHRQIAVVLVNCVNFSASLVRVSGISLVSWVLAGWLFWFENYLWGAAVLVAMDELIWVTALSRLLTSRGFVWPAGLSMVGGGLAAALSGAGLVWVGETAGVLSTIGYLPRTIVWLGVAIPMFAVVARMAGLWTRRDILLAREIFRGGGS